MELCNSPSWSWSPRGLAPRNAWILAVTLLFFCSSHVFTFDPSSCTSSTAPSPRCRPPFDEDHLLSQSSLLRVPDLADLSHQALRRVADVKGAALDLPDIAQVTEEVTRIIVRRKNITRTSVWVSLRHLMINPADCPLSEASNRCSPELSKYRTYDGSCNNLEHPSWGKAGTPFRRIQAPIYGDGISTIPETGADGGQKLPTAYEVASAFHVGQTSENPFVSALTPFWGQLVINDVMELSKFQDPGPCGGGLESREAVALRGNEDYNVCIDYRRTLPSPNVDCTLGPRQQLNQNSAFLDGSILYGTSILDLRRMRSYSAGMLKTGINGLPERLTESTGGAAVQCQLLGGCFSLGNLRVNENAGQVSLATILLREHNRIASTLSLYNPHWTDERAFQEARRILVAQIQHITFNEFLYTILDETLYEKSGLAVTTADYFTGYSSDVHPGIANSVGASVIGFVSTMFPLNITIVNTTTGETQMLRADSGQYNPSLLRNQGDLDSLLLGLVRSRSSNVGPTFGSPEASQFFAAYSVMQGRDHGLPGYESFRSWCGLPKVKSFQDLRGILRSDVDIKKLEQLYGTISAMDLVTAGLLEAPTDGSLLGPTFACLISEQFRRMKLGDRFWYESDLPPLSFSRDQLREIQKVTLAGMICANSGVNRLQPRVFLSEDDFLNAPVFCVNLPHLSLEPWRELEPPEVVVPSELLESSIALARNDLAERTETEKRLVQDRRTADPKGPIGTAYSFHAPSKAACQVANVSLMLEFATRELSRQLTAEGHDLSFVVEAQRKRKKRQIDNFIPTGADFNQIFVGDRLPFPAHLTCPENDDTGPCDPKGAFRSYSGYCNNLQKPNYGKSLTPFNRLLASSYEDGISDPRASSVTGRPLPSPRIVSSFIHSDVSRLHNRYSMMMMQVGQFLDHDITFTPVHRGFQDSLLDCRDCSSAQTVHPECFPIPVPQNDPYYPPVNLSTGVPMCIPLVRSLPGQTRLGPREQLNQNTAFLDGSQVYGQNSCDARKLRAFLGGRLNVTAHPGRGKDLLPQTHGIAECKSPSSVCFVGGDTRPSEQPGLATIHTIFLREHNRIAAELNRVNPHWGDEQTYQTARKIVIAKIQHVTFNEFLPRVLGWNAIKLYELDLQAQGYYNGYDVKCNPGALNEFGAAAFRFGHSLIRPQLHRYDTNYRTLEPFLQLRENFNNPDKIYDVNMIDEIMRGLLSTPMESLDQFVTREVTNHLFEDQRNQYSGLDLVAINVQRARDHGIRPYNDYRVICNLKRAQDFDDLQREIPLEIIERYKQIYAHVDDIDLFTGGLSERPLEGGLVGPTFGCIIGLQFRFLRKCDRFWYETGDPVVRFTEGQLQEIRKATLAKLFCINCDIVDKIQRRSLDIPHQFLNPRLECHDLPVVNIEAWKEPPPSVVNGNGCLIGGNVIQLGQAALPSPCVQCVCTTEGANCQSLRITNCQQLLATQPREAVIADRVCRAQCGQLIQEQASGRTGRALAGAGRPSNVFRPPPPPPQAQAQALRQENQAPLRPPAFPFLNSA